LPEQYAINVQRRRHLTYTVINDSEVYGSIFYIGDNISSDTDDGQDTDEEEDEDYTIEIETGDGVTGVVSNETVPEGYPEDFCPLYPGADLLSADELGDDEMTMYTIALLTKDDMDTVSEYYQKNENVGMLFGDYALGLESEDGKTTGQIHINKAEDTHLEQGYNSFIVITVIVQ